MLLATGHTPHTHIHVQNNRYCISGQVKIATVTNGQPGLINVNLITVFFLFVFYLILLKIYYKAKELDRLGRVLTYKVKYVLDTFPSAAMFKNKSKYDIQLCVCVSVCLPVVGGCLLAFVFFGGQKIDKTLKRCSRL